MNLGSEFLRAAVRQVGRDGGKVISNRIYNRQHGTPIYNSGQNIGIQSKQIVDISEVKMDLQPRIKGGGVGPFLKGMCLQIIPVIGHLIVLVKGLRYLKRKTVNVYVTAPNKVADRRYKLGYRIEGYSLVKTNTLRYLQPEEKRRFKNRGISYLLSIVVGLIFFTIFINAGKTTIKPHKYAQVERSGINIRLEPTTDSPVVMQIPQGDSIRIIDENGPLETINEESAHWIKIEYEEKIGWIWGGLLTIN